MTEESNQASVPPTDANSAPTTAAPSVGRISAPLPPPRTMPFGPSLAPPPPPSRTGRPSVAPPPPSRTGTRPASGRPLPPPSRASIPDIEAPAPSSPSQVSATEIDAEIDSEVEADVNSTPSTAEATDAPFETAAVHPAAGDVASTPVAAPDELGSAPSPFGSSPVSSRAPASVQPGAGFQTPAFQAAVPPAAAPQAAAFEAAVPQAPVFHAPDFQAPSVQTSDVLAPPQAAPPSAPGLGSNPHAVALPFPEAPAFPEASSFPEPAAFAEPQAYAESQSAPGTPPLDHVFATEDEPESQDGSVLSAGRVLSQPAGQPSLNQTSLDRPSLDPSTPFTDDDEDEATRVLDNREIGLSRRVNSALKSSLRSSVAPPPPPGLGSRPSTTHPPMSVHPVRPPSAMPPPSAPPMGLGFPSRIPPAAPAPGSSPFQINPYEPPSAPAFAHLTVPPKAAKEKRKWPLLALAAGVIAAAITWFVLGSAGSLLVTVAGPGNSTVKGVKVFVNGTERCAQTPCEVKGLSAGSYIVRAEAAGFEPSAEQAVVVESGKPAAYNIQLKSSVAKPLLTVTTVSPGLRVLIDGKDRGTAPLELSDITPGSHTVRVEGPGFEPIEQSINIVADSPQTIGPLNPRLLKGSLRLELGTNAEGAQVLVNGKGIRSLPATLELDATQSHEVLVRKLGFEDFQRKVSFSATEPKHDLTINLVESTGGASGARHVGSDKSSEASGSESGKAAEDDKKTDFLSAVKGDAKDDKASQSAKKPDDKATDKPTDKPVATGKGTLNINSVPPTTVLLDGKPLGMTPRAGVSVPAGSHTVTFIHPEKGRKQVKVDVPSGASKNVTIRL